ncbi:MAG: ribose-5-phosphate isomerase [Candidatus Saccharimonadales bacterium]
MKIALSTDHAGFDSIEPLKDYINELGYDYQYFGPENLNIDDDYPDFIFPAARAVSSNQCQAAIILGGSGQGEAMAANRIQGVRCTVFYSPAIALSPIDAEGRQSDDAYEILRLSRQHNHANVLSLSGRFLSIEEIKIAIRVWLETPYSDNQRHVRRVSKLDETVE